ACREANPGAVRHLLSLDADPGSAHTAGGLNTPLHAATRGGSVAAVRLLLRSSANALAPNAHGDLPIHLACRGRGRLDLARCLVAGDPDRGSVAARNFKGRLPLDLA
ncbi:unnamed protein product, partial [Discosporangium mesarthrocarpum]